MLKHGEVKTEIQKLYNVVEKGFRESYMYLEDTYGDNKNFLTGEKKE